MNRTNVQRTIDYLRALPSHPELPAFDMGMWIEKPDYSYVARVQAIPDTFECGTTACIAGHIAIGFRNEMECYLISDSAGRFLGLTDHQRDHLFHGLFRTEDQVMTDISLDQAIAELERMLKEDMARA